LNIARPRLCPVLFGLIGGPTLQCRNRSFSNL
jgi:hypothetical protein